MIKATSEQSAILRTLKTNQSLKINALAGTGKTSTLLMIAQAYPDRKGLYTAYNTALVKEAKAKFPKHIKCQTTHGIAMPFTGFPFLPQLNGNPSRYETYIREYAVAPIHLTASFFRESIPVRISPYKKMEWAKKIVGFYCGSAHEELVKNRYKAWIERECRKQLFRAYSVLKDAIDTHSLSQDQDQRTWDHNIISPILDSVFSLAQNLWDLQSSATDTLITANHDTYLKLFQLSKPQLKGYDYCLIDEAQDLNPCFLDILKQQTMPILYVGDKNQQIYEWRGTNNAMESVGDLPSHVLTQSFRFGDDIADEANTVLDVLDPEGQEPRLKGLPSIESRLDPFMHVSDGPLTVLGATNAALFLEAIPFVTEGHPCWIKNADQIIKLIESVIELKNNGGKGTIVHPLIRSFTSYEELELYQSIEQDPDLSHILTFVDRPPEEVAATLTIMRKTQGVAEEDADMIFSTAHGSKGREWSRVKLINDFRPLRNNDESVYVPGCNLMYVALTRAQHELSHNGIPFYSEGSDCG